jgi:protease II
LKIKNTSEITKYLKNPGTKKIFIKRLSKYITCFTSSVHDTHCILMKVFEILSSGSILIYPKKEEEYIQNIGLVDRKNCFLINFNENIQEQINFVLSYENREYIKSPETR